MTRCGNRWAGIVPRGSGWFRRRWRRIAAWAAAALLAAAVAGLTAAGGGGAEGDPRWPEAAFVPGEEPPERSGGCSGCGEKGGTIVPAPFDRREPPPEAAAGAPLATGWKGRFADVAGRPVSGARIQAIPPLQRDGGHYSAPWTASAETGAEGDFRVVADVSVAADAPTLVTLACEGGESGRLLFHSRRVELVPGRMVDLGELRAGSTGANYLVTVRDASGAPLPGARVRFVFPTGPFSGVTAETGDLGTAEVLGLACFGDTDPDHFRCFVENARELAAPAVPRVEPPRAIARIGSRNVDFVVHFEEPPETVLLAMLLYRGVSDGRACGVVLGCGRSGVLQSYRGVQLAGGENAWPLGIPKANPEGAERFVEVYALDGSGEYLRAPLRPGVVQGMEALVAEASVWRRGVEIQGRLVRDDGTPAAGVSVFLQLPGRGDPGGPRYREAATDAQGRFEFHGLPPGLECELAASAGGVRRLRRIRVSSQPPAMDLLDISWSP